MRRTFNSISRISKISEKRARAFSITEILIAMIIVSILGGAAVISLWIFFNSFLQMDDYTSAEFELNHAIQRLKRDFALIGLGMPNNRDGEGSFAATFMRGANSAEWPIMARMGGVGEAWGGPVTAAGGNSTNVFIEPASMDAAHGFIGPQLFYAYGVPTGVNARIANADGGLTAVNNTMLTITPFLPNNSSFGTVMEHLENIRHDGRQFGLETTFPLGQNVRSWLLFPTLRLPALFHSWGVNSAGRDVLNVQVAPADALNVESSIMSIDEIHMLQAARLFRSENNELVRFVFTGSGGSREVLARNIVGLQFAFNPASRLLTMYIASRGYERNPSGGHGQPNAWPTLPFEQLDPEDTSFRIVVKTLTWRIRN